MRWLEETLDRLASARRWSYHAGGPAAAEPTALAALALLAHHRPVDAARAIDWITRAQSANGTVGVTKGEDTPCWPTALAVLAWRAWNDANGTTRYDGCIERAIGWTLAARGHTMPRSPQIGHDTTLAGWPWVKGTHSWLEPSAFFVLALKSAGYRDHPRTREAVRLLVDRLLPSGGCNCGNTIVMGQELLPHVQPTGLVLLALAGERTPDRRVARSIAYLERSLHASLGPASLAFAVMGLAAHGRRPANWETLLEEAPQRRSLIGTRTYTDALLAVAALEHDENPLAAVHPVPLAHRESSEGPRERALAGGTPAGRRLPSGVPEGGIL